MSGIFGIISGKDVSEQLLLGVDYHSHMGTEYGGLAVLDDEGSLHKKIHSIAGSQFKSKFIDEYRKLNGKAGIGVISDSNEQPLVFNSKYGSFALCANGLVSNKQELVDELIAGGETFSEFREDGVNTAELAATLINKGKSLVDGVSHLFDVIKGSLSILILNEDGIYVANDRNSRFPLVIGKGDKGWAAATETCSFSNLGLKIEKYVGPDEIILLTKDGMKSVKKNSDCCKVCSFLWIYTGFPTSNYEGVNAEVVRERCGRALAKRNQVKA
ncbi:amidophosphoribosyltransferase, partial [Candidatus Altiarchaeota archaeon]